MADWYAVQVETGKEDATLRELERAARERGMSEALAEAFVPKRCAFERRQGVPVRVELPLFPGYLIVSCERRDLSRVARLVASLMRFARVLSFDGVFVPLLPEETEWIRAFTHEGDRTVGVSEGFVEGGRVTVVRGPLLGLETTIKKVNRRKRTAVVELSMCGRVVETELALELMRRHRGALLVGRPAGRAGTRHELAGWAVSSPGCLRGPDKPTWRHANR